MPVGIAGARRRVSWTQFAISPLGLGLSRIISLTSRVGRQDALKLLHAAFDRGINVFDTADIYGQGESERLIGKASAGRRDQLVICTKIGYRLSAKARAAAVVKPILRPLISRSPAAQASANKSRPRGMAQDFSPRYLQRAIDRSLRRLKTDYIDLLLLHSPPTAGLDWQEASAALETSERAGKIRAFGVSARSFADAEEWVRRPGIGAVQLPFGSREQEGSAALLAQARERKVGIIAREVLSGSEAVRDGQRGPPAVASGRSFTRDAIRNALSAPLTFGGVDLVLVGTTRIDHLTENIAAVTAGLAAQGAR